MRHLRWGDCSREQGRRPPHQSVQPRSSDRARKFRIRETRRRKQHRIAGSSHGFAECNHQLSDRNAKINVSPIAEVYWALIHQSMTGLVLGSIDLDIASAGRGSTNFKVPTVEPDFGQKIYDVR